MKKQYNFVQIAKEIEKKLKDPSLTPKERYLLQREIEYHRGVNYKFDLKEKISLDFNSNLLETKNYAYLTYILDSLSYNNYKVVFHRKRNKKHELFKLSKEVFENIDLNHLNIINNLSNHEYELYRIEKTKVEDHCFYSEYLKLPFVTITDDSTVLTIIKLVHEMQHQVNFMINPISALTQFREVTPLFLELFATEYLYKKTNDKEFLKAYLSRMKEISEIANILKAYLEMLTYYGENHDIDFREALKKYEFKEEHLEELDVAKIVSYLLSFLMALSVKETFKNDSEKGLKYLYSVIDGSIMSNNIYLNDEYEKGLEICNRDYHKVMKKFKKD